MRDDLRDRLRTSLSAPRGPGESARAPGGEAAPGDRFIRDFLAKAERVVCPAMLEVGRLLESHGRFFSIERIAERTSGRGVLIPTSVQMNVFRRQRTTNFKHGAPHFNVVCDPAGRQVLFRRTLLLSGTGPEDCGQCALDALTRDLVQDKLAAMLDVLTRM